MNPVVLSSGFHDKASGQAFDPAFGERVGEPQRAEGALSQQASAGQRALAGFDSSLTGLLDGRRHFD